MPVEVGWREKKLERNERTLRLRDWRWGRMEWPEWRVSDCQQMSQWRRGEGVNAEKAIRNDKPGGSRVHSHIDCIINHGMIIQDM